MTTQFGRVDSKPSYLHPSHEWMALGNYIKHCRVVELAVLLPLRLPSKKFHPLGQRLNHQPSHLFMKKPWHFRKNTWIAWGQTTDGLWPPHSPCWLTEGSCQAVLRDPEQRKRHWKKNIVIGTSLHVETKSKKTCEVLFSTLHVPWPSFFKMLKPIRSCFLLQNTMVEPWIDLSPPSTMTWGPILASHNLFCLT